jgi:aminomethyltransferase
MGYVTAGHQAPGGTLFADLRSQRVPMRVVPLPFVPHSYHR